jgi:hypothetical protein
MARLARRDVLKTGAALGTTLGLGNLGFLNQLPPVAAEETKLDPKVVRLESGIEPLVQLLEQTPRGQLLEEVGARIKKGLTYKELLAAIFLAGVRNIEPRPSVGFKFHSVLVVNSAHLSAQSTTDERQRWLPIFWAIDNFKSGQARDQEERGWTMPPVEEAAVPSKDKARAAFLEAMEAWNEPAADAAIAGLVRTAEPAEVYELLFRLGSRDLRSIGHKSIYVANSFRTLKFIGWQYAEPILRSLVYAMLAREGSDPLKGDAPTDRPYKRNGELVKKIREGWREGKLDEGATRSMIDTLRTGSAEAACDQVVELLNKEVSPQSIWDAIFVESGELLMRQPAIVALHSVTTTNAVHVAYQTATDDETRRLLLLQNAAFVTMFREAMKGRGALADRSIDKLKPAEPAGEGEAAIRDVFETLGGNPTLAAEKTLSFLKQEGRAKELIDAARVLVFLKGNDSHDYKFSAAVLEDYERVSPAWRNLYLASNLFNLRHSKEKDNDLVKRTEAALG